MSSCGSTPPTATQSQDQPKSAPASTVAPTSAPKSQEAPKATQPPAVAPTSAPAQPTAAPKVQVQPTTPPQPADPNKGITFGKPVLFTVAGFTTVGVLATNTTDQVKSFTVKATFKTGDKIAATANGAVNDIRPGQTRAVSMVSTSPIPTTYDSVRVDVDTMIREAKTTPGADAAAKIKFGEPAVKTNAGFTTIDLEATNGDTAVHSFTVQIAFLKGDELVGLANGAVNDLEAGQTKTATLAAVGAIPAYDKMIVNVDTLVK